MAHEAIQRVQGQGQQASLRRTVDSGTSGVGTFRGLVGTSLPMLVSGSARSASGQGLTGTVVGWNCGGSGGTGSGWNQSLRSIKPTATSLSFSEANCWVSLAKFSKSSFGEMSIWSLVRLLLGRLRAALPADVSAEGWLLGSRARCRMSGTLVIVEASGEVPATFAFISGGSQAAMALTQLREGVAALRVVARGVSWGTRLRAVAAEAWVSPLQRSACPGHLLEQSGTTGSPHCPEKCPAALQEPGGDPSVFIGREEHHRKREGLRSQVTTLRGRCEEWSVQGGVGAALAGVWA